ncbi:MAG: hypothetical protein K0R52_255 [Alphaproteobacteria bacterium]|jgi:hypothetical protein|nr:hypothetical protein [Alphaproteobacteria bacterium]
MRKKYICFIAAVANVFSTVATQFLAVESAKGKDLSSYSSTFLFPINCVGEQGTHIYLQFNSPKGFRCLQQELVSKALGLNGSDSNNIGLLETVPIEFIPKDDSESSWSKIITFNMFIGKSVKADLLVSNMKEAIINNSKESKILEENKSQNDSFETANLAIAYTHNGRREVVRVVAFSGPLDCISIQYAALLKEGQTDDAVFQNVKSWMASPQSLQIVKF